MKNAVLFTAATLSSLALCTASLNAAGYDSAEFTRLHNQVNVVRADNVPRNANVGEKIDRVSSVTTGDASRAELRFPDKSLTRLGANSRFTLRGGERTIDLDEGVMLLQVPKKIGGAKVRTAAVTAAVTGTTVLFEYLPGGFIKLIVIEGEVDLYFNNKPSVFRTIKAGEMIIMKADGDTIPEPVDIDLERLLKTSKLISGDDEWMPNHQQVADAVQEQQDKLKKGELVGTTLYLPGRGTQVVLTSKTRLDVVTTQPDPPANQENDPGNPPPDGSGNGGNPGVPAEDPPTGVPGLIAGTTVLNETSAIETNPHVTAFNSITGPGTVSQGVLYHGDEPFPYFGFGSNTALDLNPAEPRMQGYLSHQAPWAVFKFEDLLINGTPNFTIIETPNVILSAVGDVRLLQDDSFGPEAGGGSSTELNLFETSINNLTLYSQTGHIQLGPEFSIRSDYASLALIAAGPASDILIQGTISLGEGGFFANSFSTSNVSDFSYGRLLLSAGRDLTIQSPPDAQPITVVSNGIDAQAGRDVHIEANVTSYGHARITARRNLNITSSGALRAIAGNPELLAKLEALEGDITITGNADDEIYNVSSSGTLDIQAYQGNITIHDSFMSAEVFKARALGDSGWVTIGNSHLSAGQVMKLYAEGNNGGVRFNGYVDLNANDITIAGKTVEITSGGTVNLSGSEPSLKVFTDNPQFNTENKGSFKRNGDTYPVTPQPHGAKPAY